MNREKLKLLLKEGKENFGQYWEANWEKIRDVYLRLVNQIIDGDLSQTIYYEDKGLLDEYRDIDKCFWFIFGVKGEKALDEKDRIKLREFLIEIRNSTHESDAADILKKYEGKIKGLQTTSLTTWASIIHPNWFVPLWGSPKDKRGVINPYTAPILEVDYIRSLDQYFEVLRNIKEVAKEVGISNMIEVAFYLSKYRKTGITLVEALYELRGEYLQEWFKVKKDFIDVVGKIKEIISEKIDNDSKFEEDDVIKIIELRNSVPKDTNFILRYMGGSGADKQVILNLVNDNNFRDLVKYLKGERDELDFKDVSVYLEKIKVGGVRLTTLSTWMAIIRWDLFMPLWGFEKQSGTFPQRLCEEIEDLSDLCGWYPDNISKFLKMLKKLKEAANEVGINNMFEVAFYLSKYVTSNSTDSIGIMGVIAWSHNRWRGFDEEGYQKRNDYGFDYVKNTGIAHEWWNFYEDFNDIFYFGNIAGGRRVTRFQSGLIVFISRNINDNKWYFIGFYGKSDYNQEGFSTGKKFADLLPENIKKELKEKLKRGEIKEKYSNDLNSVLSENAEDYRTAFRGQKDLSAVFDPECYVEVTPENIGVSGIGSMTFTYIDNRKRENIRHLFLMAKQRHEDLLKRENLPDERKKEVMEIMNKIELAIEKYFGENEKKWGGDFREFGQVL